MLLPRRVVLLSACLSFPDAHQLKKKTLILAHCCRGFSLYVVGSEAGGMAEGHDRGKKSRQEAAKQHIAK